MITIRPSDGDVKPGGPLGAFREEQAMSRHRISPSPFLSSSSSSSHTTQLHYTNSHPNLNFLQYTIQILVPHAMWFGPSGASFENRPYLMPSIRLVRNPKRVIVQWVGTGTEIILNSCPYSESYGQINLKTSRSGDVCSLVD